MIVYLLIQNCSQIFESKNWVGNNPSEHGHHFALSDLNKI